MVQDLLLAGVEPGRGGLKATERPLGQMPCG